MQPCRSSPRSARRQSPSSPSSASRGTPASTADPATTCCRPRCSASTRSGRWSKTRNGSDGPSRTALDIDEVLEIEPGRFLTFEYIGPTDFFGESPDGERTRGARCTSVDAAFLFHTATGRRELALVEWKYTESYRTREPEPEKDEVRRQRYGTALHDPDGPVRDDVLPFDALLDEPIYQLVRQQLLAWELEKAKVHDVDRVRVVHVMPSANVAYGASLGPLHREVGDTVHEVWEALLRRPDRFISLDNSVFADPAVTSQEYVSRYGEEDGPHDQ